MFHSNARCALHGAILVVVLTLFCTSSAMADPAGIAELMRLLPASEAWNRWAIEKQPSVPDYDSLTSISELPDPLTMADGTPVTSPQQWETRRKQMQDLLEQYIYGSCPPPPQDVRVIQLFRHMRDSDANNVREEFMLEFGPDYRAKLGVFVIRPVKPGKYPVFMVPGLDWYREWLPAPMHRGYIIVGYYGNDARDWSYTLTSVYPEATWSKLRRRAWEASRIIDFLVQQEWVDSEKIAITGHSRDAAQAMIVAAFDTRIGAVVNSSAGAGFMPVRYADESYFSESIERVTRTYPDWFRPEFRFFSGREHKLPADFNFLAALIAPRPLLLSTAFNDWVQGTWPLELLYKDAQRVYRFLGAEENLAILSRPGLHDVPDSTAVRYTDFFDKAFGRADSTFGNEPFHPYSFEAWRVASGASVDVPALPQARFVSPASRTEWAERRIDVRRRLNWLLGTGRRSINDQFLLDAGESEAVAKTHARENPPEKVEKIGVTFGDDIKASIYLPKGHRTSGKRLPAIVWCAPQNWATGYGGVYADYPQAYVSLATSGMVTMCFDPIGTGNRLEERRNFYRDWPEWSLMGKMVYDTRCAVAALRQCEFVDPNQIYLVGYANGGTVAIMAAALEDLVAGVATVCGFTPMRTDTPDKGTPGIARYWKIHGTIPLLGLFAGNESRIPVDFDEILAAVAPRPALVVSPTLDRYATHADVLSAIASAGQVYTLYSATDALQNYSPKLFNSFQPEMHRYVVDWLKSVAK